MDEAITAHDRREAYCHRLGHHLTFAYCRSPGGEEPCGQILDCWFERFDVASFMAASYPRFTPGADSAAPKPKLLTLVELIQRAQGGAG